MRDRITYLECWLLQASKYLDMVAPRRYFEIMRAVGLKVLKNKLSEYVRLAASGETVLVTDRDRVVAELVPPREGRSPLLADALLAEAVRRGWITPPALPATSPPPRAPVASLHTLLQELAQDREDR
jgi:antitoxin (DNA-binding transcriptional repressor) of toxin-antitoxin stability system